MNADDTPSTPPTPQPNTEADALKPIPLAHSTPAPLKTSEPQPTEQQSLDNLAPKPKDIAPTPPQKPSHRADEPPDLEEVWSDFTHKIKQVLGRSDPSKTKASPSKKRASSADLSPQKVHHSKANTPDTRSYSQIQPNPTSATSNNPSPSTPVHTKLLHLRHFKPRFKLSFASFLLLLGVWLSSGVMSVPEGSVGVVTQFGEHVMTYAPGFAWHVPYPIQTDYVIDITGLRKLRLGNKTAALNTATERTGLMLTQESSLVSVPFELQYHLKDNSELAYLFGNTAVGSSAVDLNHRADGLVAQIADIAMREEISKYTVDTLLNKDRSSINQAVQVRLQQLLDRYTVRRTDTDQTAYFDTGVHIAQVSIQAIMLPESLRNELESIDKATQDKARAISDAKAYANDTDLRAKATSERLLLEAQGYKYSVMQAATGEAARFKAVETAYAKAPALTRQRLYLDTLQQLFENTSKLLTDLKGTSHTLYLPLDKLLAQTSSMPATSTVTGSNVTSAAQPNSASLVNTPKETVKDLAKEASKDLPKAPMAPTSHERDMKEFR
jgi:modulator of FtsH protease HflK